MKEKLFLVLMILGFIFTIQCGGGNVYSGEECEATFNGLFDKIAASSSEEDMAKFAPMKATLMGKLKKDCMSGKFDLECINNASNIAAMQTCLK